MATKDISAKFSLKSSETELTLAPGQTVMGENVGGLTMFSNQFRAGSGNNVWGFSVDKGFWIGAADFDDAPFKVDMNGRMYFSSEDNSGNQLVIDAVNLQIVLYVAGVPQAFWGLGSF